MGRRTRQRLAKLENPTEGDRNQWQVQRWQEIQNAVANRGIDVSKRKGRREARKFIASNPDIGWFEANQYVKLLKEKEKQAQQFKSQQRALKEVQSIGTQLNTNITPPSYNQEATDIPPNISNWRMPEGITTNKSFTHKQKYVSKLNNPTNKSVPIHENDEEEVYDSNFYPQVDTNRDYEFLDKVDLRVLNPHLLSGIGILRGTNPGMREQLTNWEIQILKGKRLDRNAILKLLGAHSLNPINEIYKAWVKDYLNAQYAQDKVDRGDYDYNMEVLNRR